MIHGPPFVLNRCSGWENDVDTGTGLAVRDTFEQQTVLTAERMSGLDPGAAPWGAKETRISV